MQRFLIFFSLMPLLVAVIMRKINSDRVLRASEKVEVQKSALESARKMLDALDREEVDIQLKESRWPGMGTVGKNSLVLPAEFEHDDPVSTAKEHAYAAFQVGLFMLAEREPEVIKRRQWAIRFGHVFPIFTTLVVVFALVVNKLPGVWALAVIMASLAIATLAQFLSVSCDRRAAELAHVIIDKKRIFPRLSEEESVTEAIRAYGWYSILPGILARFL